MNRTNRNATLKLIAAIIFIYFILFELVLTPVKFIPKPSLLFESLQSLISDYRLVASISISAFTVLVTFIAAAALLWIFRSIMIKVFSRLQGLDGLIKIFSYFSLFFFILIFIHFFPNSYWAELIFIFIVTIGALKLSIFEETSNVKYEYLISARSLGMNEDEIIRKVIWKSIHPKVIDKYLKTLPLIWFVLFVYEFLSENLGVGNIFKALIQYNDYTGLITMGICSAVVMWLFELILKYIRGKLFFWE